MIEPGPRIDEQPPIGFGSQTAERLETALFLALLAGSPGRRVSG